MNKIVTWFKEYKALAGFIVCASVFAAHLVNDVKNGNFGQIDDHFFQTFMHLSAASDEAMDQADD